MSRVRGKGDRGAEIFIGMVPDANLKAYIDAAKNAGTVIEGKLLVKLGDDNYEATQVSDGDTPLGKVVTIRAIGTSYELTVSLLCGIREVFISTNQVSVRDALVAASDLTMRAATGGDIGVGKVLAVNGQYVDWYLWPDFANVAS